MKRLAVNTNKRKSNTGDKYHDRKDQKYKKCEYLKENENKKSRDQHDYKLSRRNRPDNLILHIDKLWNRKLIHTRSVISRSIPL